MKKSFIAWGALAVSILTGAVFRALPGGESFPAGGEYRKPVLLFDGEPPLHSGPLTVSGDQEVPADGTLKDADDSSSPRSGSPKKKPGTGKPDLESLKHGVKPRKGNPGDLKDYLDEADRARRERVRKSLEEIRKKVREWEPNIFEPTW
jgi:hypothetical protein